MRHSTNLALQTVPASAPPRRGTEMSAILCRLALGGQATSVARRLGRRVVVVGLLDATNSKAAKSGTAHRLACAESAGLSVQRFSWGLAPQQQEAAPAAAE